MIVQIPCLVGTYTYPRHGIIPYYTMSRVYIMYKLCIPFLVRIVFTVVILVYTIFKAYQIVTDTIIFG
jgi:hypothetical protein